MFRVMSPLFILALSFFSAVASADGVSTKGLPFTARPAFLCKPLLEPSAKKPLSPELLARIDAVEADALSVAETPAARQGIQDYFALLRAPDPRNAPYPRGMADFTRLTEALHHYLPLMPTDPAVFEAHPLWTYTGWEPEDVAKWHRFASLVLEQMERRVSGAEPLTYGDYLTLIVDYSFAISAVRFLENDHWVVGATQLRDMEFPYEHRVEEMQNLIRAAPFVQVLPLFPNPGMSGFNEMLMIPGVLVGLATDLNVFDGGVRVGLTTADYETYWRPPMDFTLTHDLSNHGSRTLNSFADILAMNQDGEVDVSVTIEGLLDAISARIQVWRRIKAVTAGFSALQREAMHVVIFYMFHESDESLSILTLGSSLEQFLEGSSEDELSHIASRILEPNDLGEDLPLLKALGDQDRIQQELRDAANRIISLNL